MCQEGDRAALRSFLPAHCRGADLTTSHRCRWPCKRLRVNMHERGESFYFLRHCSSASQVVVSNGEDIPGNNHKSSFLGPLVLISHHPYIFMVMSCAICNEICSLFCSALPRQFLFPLIKIPINLLFIIYNAISLTDLDQYPLYTFIRRNSMSTLKGHLPYSVAVQSFLLFQEFRILNTKADCSGVIFRIINYAVLKHFKEHVHP